MVVGGKWDVRGEVSVILEDPIQLGAWLEGVS